MTQVASQPGPIGDVTCVEGETFCISGHSGQVRRGSEQGLYIRDLRVLNHLTVTLDGGEPLVLRGHTVGGNAARFTACRSPGTGDEPDPTLLLDRRRVVSTSLWEALRLRNFGTTPLTVDLAIEVDCDFASVFEVKHAQSTRQARCEGMGRDLRFARGDLATIVRLGRRPDDVDERHGLWHWRIALEPRDEWIVDLQVGFSDSVDSTWPRHTWDDAGVEPQPPSVAWRTPRVDCTEADLPDLVEQSVADLGSLLVEDPEAPGDHFFAAGSPWYLTLFGRDALWAASMALPLGLEVPGGTLRALARRQGRAHDPETEEAPGKIIHEVRHGGLVESSVLPPLYWGTLDATPLFVTLVHEAWCWGLPDDEVTDLLPAVEAALTWMERDGDADGDGFLEYHQAGQRGLANQGWKDSVDGVQFADGRLAEPPIALCEVQGYAHEAARRGAALLEGFGRPGAEHWRAWAAALKARFRSAFWIDDDEGGYPAVALDGDKQRVDGLASNMGHLPGTGILSPADCAAVARHLTRPDMATGWGLRTLTAYSPRFNPLSYHGGSVWPHDTAIAAANLAAAGQVDAAAVLLRSLVEVAGHFDMRLPELFGGEQRRRWLEPLPYPAACRPQAWAAGAVLLLLRAALGIHPDLPNGRLALCPLWPPPYRRLTVEGLRLGGGTLSLTVDAEDGVEVHESPPGMRVDACWEDAERAQRLRRPWW